MLKNITLIAFLLMCLAQLYVPAKMVLQQENIKEKGLAFKFKTEPVDPYDPFRGKYIRLNFANSNYSTDDTTVTIPNNGIAYALLDTDQEGFAIVQKVTPERPPSNANYITVEPWYITKRGSTREYNLRYSFDRLYLEESKAPAAEKLYFNALRDSQLTTYALVYVHQGQASLTDVFINETPISQWVEQQQNQAPDPVEE